ncbi:hypothetical protein ABVK25_004224 [Lepraria finkii]|uniref:Uncharacterized protein n=1 Tax=Lepraria finkii TaxID=1340010 RepID=A0ABR4BEG4_9LECA
MDISMIQPSIWLWPIVVPEERQRNLYHEMSSNSSDILPPGALNESSDRAVSPTDISFANLRYRNWKTINSLLMQAEAFESRPERSKNSDGSTYPHHSPWLLEQLDDIRMESTKQYTEQEWRDKILNLRSPNYCPPQTRQVL